MEEEEARLGDTGSLGRRGREGSGGGEEAETVAAPKPQLLGGRVWEAQVETDAPPVSPKWRAQREGGSVGPLARFSVGWGSLPGAKYSHPPRDGEEAPEPRAHLRRARQGRALALRPFAPPSPPPLSPGLPPPPRGPRGAGFFSGARWAGAGAGGGREPRGASGAQR